MSSGGYGGQQGGMGGQYGGGARYGMNPQMNYGDANDQMAYAGSSRKGFYDNSMPKGGGMPQGPRPDSMAQPFQMPQLPDFSQYERGPRGNMTPSQGAGFQPSGPPPSPGTPPWMQSPPPPNPGNPPWQRNDEQFNTNNLPAFLRQPQQGPMATTSAMSDGMNKGGVQAPMVYPGMPGAPSSPPGYNRPWQNIGQNAQQNWANMLAGWGAQRGAAMGVPAPYGRSVNGNPRQNPAWNPRAEGRMGGNTGGAYQGGWEGYQSPGTPPIMLGNDADLPLSEILWRQRGGAPRPV